MRAAITGAGVVTRVGIGLAEFSGSLRLGRQSLTKLQGIPVPRGKSAAGLVADARFDGPDRAFRMAKTAIAEALDLSKPVSADPQNVALILATVNADDRALEDLYPKFICDGAPDPGVLRALPLYSNGALLNALGNYFRFFGPRLVVSNACASGNIALGIALDMIRMGRCRTAIVPGVELFKITTLWGAERAAIVGRALRPFHSRRDGSVLGEGSGALILQHP